MAVQMDQGMAKDDLKTQFVTREGTYRLMALSEYSRPNRVGYTSNQGSPQVRVSIVTLPAPTLNHHSVNSGGEGVDERDCASAVQVHQVSSATAATNQSLNAIDPFNGGGSSSAANNNGICGPGVGGGERICFNFGKELFVYSYRGVKKVSQTESC